MRFIRCARHKQEQNLFAFQYLGRVFYRTFKPIVPGQEMLVWYDEKYPQYLGIPWTIFDMGAVIPRGKWSAPSFSISTSVLGKRKYYLQRTAMNEGERPRILPWAFDLVRRSFTARRWLSKWRHVFITTYSNRVELWCVITSTDFLFLLLFLVRCQFKAWWSHSCFASQGRSSTTELNYSRLSVSQSSSLAYFQSQQFFDTYSGVPNW